MPQARRGGTAQREQEDTSGTVQRNFMVREDQAEWLRLTAFMRRTSQAKLLREAIDDLKRKYEGAEPLPPQAPERS